MLDFCIIGSGISGSTIANLLNKKCSVAVYDKARGFGGEVHLKNIKIQSDLITDFNLTLQNLQHLKHLLINLLRKKF